MAAMLGGATILVWSSALFAAESANDTDKTEDEELTEVQVTGTRIQSPNVTSASPVTSISGEEMRRLGIVNVADALTQLVPQNISSYAPTLTGDDQGGANGRGSYFIGNTIANLRGLDPQFGSRTLTLIDGRRVVSTSNQADVVDLNIIPSNLLERMDVVTGGASATYGSGAMAGVVNLVLNRRLTGFNLDLDYGVNEAGDGSSPHISVSGGTPLFGGRGHVLLGAEWQNQHAIRDCAAARDWCAESRAMYSNTDAAFGLPTDVSQVFSPLRGYEDQPARFETTDMRLQQFAPEGTIYYNNNSITSGYRLSPDGTGVEEYAFGYRGGTGGNSPGGTGPLVTTGTTLTPSTERKSFFTNFEYDFTSTTTGYLQASYATTDSLNKNRYTQSTTCVRFDSRGIALVQGAAAAIGQLIAFGPNPAGSAINVVLDPDTGQDLTSTFETRSPNWTVASWRTEIKDPGIANLGAPAGFGAPYWIEQNDATYNVNGSAPPTYPFQHGYGVWKLVRYGVQGANYGRMFWLLVGVVYTGDPSSPQAYYDPGTPAGLPSLGPTGEVGGNAYAFLRQLSPEALGQLQRSFSTATSAFGAIPDPDLSRGGAPLAGASATAGAAAGTTQLWGNTPCNGFTAVRKVWNPQIQQFTSQETDTWRAVAGLRGRFGSDWRWEAYYQYGATDSTSKQNNVTTNISFNFAMDAIIDSRQTIPDPNNPGGPQIPNPTYNQPICRVERDGIPVLDSTGRPLSDPEGLKALAQGCKPLNVFGSTVFPDAFDGVDEAELQRQALAYAFKDSISDGANSLQTLSMTTSGTLWTGWAGPLTGAFGLELREDKVDNKGSRGAYYQRADLARAWGDAFGGRTRVYEGYSELNFPLVSGQDGINLLSINAGLRYGIYNNKGGAGTTGQSATQNTPNWKFSAEFSPFDWVRFRATRSRDLRAAGYRDLFLNQPSVPDANALTNPWRERTPESNENQNERAGTVQVGNSQLKPEKSDTLTLGLVLSPGGWAQGMRMSIDYYTIHVQDGIAVAFAQGSPVQSCWENSLNRAAVYANGEIDPNAPPGINGQINDDLPECQAITFGVDEFGQRDLNDIVSYNTGKPTNALPYRRRGLDFNWSYNFPMNRAFESLPGSMALTVRGTRALESSGYANVCAAFQPGTFNCIQNGIAYYDLVGQIRSSTYIPGVSATPEWSGNFSASYLLGNFTGTLSARYVGAAVFDKLWSDDPNSPRYRNADGFLLAGSVDNNHVDPYLNFGLNASYDLRIANIKRFQVWGRVDNLFDKSPPFTGGGISGASPQFNDTLGRAYRMGVRLKF